MIRQLVRSIPEEKRMTKPPKFVARTSLLGHGTEDGEIVGTARVEQLHGKLIFHVDASNMSAETLRRGFSVGEFSIPEEEEPTT